MGQGSAWAHNQNSDVGLSFPIYKMRTNSKISKASLDFRSHHSRTAWSRVSRQIPASRRAGPGWGGGGRPSYLPTEANAIRGLEELCVDLVGSLDDGGNRILVLRGGDGQQGQGGQRDMILAVAETALIVAVGVQAAERGPR